MTVTLTIGNVPYTFIEDTYSLNPTTDERQRLQCDIEDNTGAHFTKGEQVVVADPVLGTRFDGVIETVKEISQYPTNIILHSIDCYDRGQFVAGKRTYTRTYDIPTYAGKIAIDQLHDVLADEGITVNFAERYETTDADFNEGILSSTIGTLNVKDGNLELSPTGSNLTITEATTAQFATGTLTGCTATGNTLQPNTVSGLEVMATLPFTQVGTDLQVNFWSGSKALGTNDTFNFSIFIASTSPAITCSVGLLFNDGSTTTGIVDQNGFAIDETTDLSLNAKDQWYKRSFSTSTYNGKTISKVYVAFGGTSIGVYTCYIQNVYLTSASGTPFFSTTATTTQLNPMTVQSSSGYAPTSVIANVYPVVIAPSTRLSTNYNIDAVKLLRSSLITWNVSGAPSDCTIAASYDGGVTYQPCTNNAVLPALPPGSNIAGLTLTLLESFVVGSDPTIIPTLQSVTVTLISAPNATTSDIVKPFATQTQWNTGTKTGVVALANGDLTTGGINSGWAQSQLLNQTFIVQGSGSTKSVNAGTYSVTVPVDSTNNQALMTRFDFAGTVSAPFSIDFDCSVPTTTNYASTVLVHYFQTYWGASASGSGKAAYQLYIGSIPATGTNIYLYQGSNSSADSLTQLANAGAEIPNHVRITVSSSHVHNIYFDNNPVPIITVTDSTYTSGQVGISAFEFHQATGYGGTGTFTFKNLLISPAPTEQWVGPSTSISSLGTCGASVISWTEANTDISNDSSAAVFVESSIDGGSTYQTCTNGGAIPNLTPGMSVSGLSVKLLISLYASPDVLYLPIIRQLVWRVLGAYPGSSGTRTTVPMVNDAIVPIARTVASGFGTAPDGQVYTKVGTATTSVGSGVALISNTTGDVHMVAGSRTWTDEDATMRFQLSASTISAGLELRYTDANNYYRLAVSTTAISIIKRRSSVTSTLATMSAALSINTWYRMRFRAVSPDPVFLYGNVWLDAVLEPTIDPATYGWNDNNWTITVAD